MVILAIPFFQLLCIPLAVVGATRIWCEEEGLVRFDQETGEMLQSTRHE
jgi:uncharacterized protein involved in cysteine biosynthesis